MAFLEYVTLSLSGTILPIPYSDISVIIPFRHFNGNGLQLQRISDIVDIVISPFRDVSDNLAGKNEITERIRDLLSSPPH
ncbi:MAG: hypothetical protein QXU18_10640 [Thermoplasmatales archaeon]